MSERRVVLRGNLGFLTGNWVVFAVYLLIHGILGICMKKFPELATLHAILIAVAAVVWVGASRSPLAPIVSVGYIAASEVLWRMCKAAVFWEYSKYLGCAVALVSLARWQRPYRFGLALSLGVLLAPGALAGMFQMGWQDARQEASFVLSGYLLLGVLCTTFSGITVLKNDLIGALALVLGPTCGIAAIALYRAGTASELIFTNASNFSLSGGFGPNQVSESLSFGVITAFFFALAADRPLGTKILAAALGVWFLAQAFLTFSRGGVYLAFIALAMFLPFAFFQSSKQCLLSIILMCMAFLGVGAILPSLDAFTGGRLAARYTNTRGTGRFELAMTEIEVWLEHPLFGAGISQAQANRSEALSLGDKVASHTEFTRLLAEHGLLGASVAFILFWYAFRRFQKAPGNVERGFLTSCFCWVFAFLTIAAFRLSVAPFLFGLGALRFVSSHRPQPFSKGRLSASGVSDGHSRP